MLCLLHTTRLRYIGDTLHIVFCILYVDEWMTSVPRLTGSRFLSADCDAQTNESALHFEGSTEEEVFSLIEMGCFPRPSPITDDEGID